MDRYLETAGLASVGGWFRRRGKPMHVEPGAPCPNCATPMQGPYCHSCGQSGDDYHRSVWKLIGEFIEGFFHADGRLWQTLPHLLLKPGRLTRDYLDGKRAPQIPPFRMFLVLLLIVFFVGHLATSNRGDGHEEPTTPRPAVSEAEKRERAATLTEAESDLRREAGPVAADAFARQVEPLKKQLETTPGPIVPKPPAPGEPPKSGAQVLHENLGPENRYFTPFTVNLDGDDKQDTAAERWLRTRVKAIRDNPDRFALLLEIWAHRVAILALPVSALLLTLLFVFNRRFYVFDHLLFSMHSLSFQLLLLTVIFLLSMLVGPAAWWLILLAPIHLYKHMRGTYSTSRFGTVLRMGFLWIGTLIGFSLLAVLWVILGANAMAGH